MFSSFGFYSDLTCLPPSASGFLPASLAAFCSFYQAALAIAFNYDLQPIHESRVDNVIFCQGAKWANVKESDFKKRVRKFYKEPHLPQQWAKDLSVKIKEKYSQKSINDLYSESFKEVL